MNTKAEIVLPDSAERLQNLIDMTVDYYWEQDANQRFTSVLFTRRTGHIRNPDLFLGRTFQELDHFPVSTAAAWLKYSALFDARKSIRDLVTWHIDDTHDVYYFSIDAQPVFDAADNFRGYCGVVRNITGTRTDEDFAGTFDLAAIGIAHVAANGRFIRVNRKLCEMLGYTADELRKLTIRQISHPDDERVTDDVRAKLRSGAINSFTMEKRYVRKSGEAIWAELTITVKRDADGHPLYDISVVADISARKAAEARVQYLATHDEMTGLPNRALFSQLLRLTIDSGTRYKRQFAVLFIDLDRFKHINDSLGHQAGDILLKEMATRFRECLRASDVVARLGGDEFVLLVQEVQDDDQVAAVARSILSAAIRPVQIMGQECRVTASIGISMFPRNGKDELSMMKNADIAMYLAKEEGKNNFQFYSPDIKTHSVEKLELESHLRNALERSEFAVHYQAKINIKTGEIRGVEALLRWDSATLGSVSPAQFIPVAEETGLIIPIGKWVLRAACQQCQTWQQRGLPPICISVNLSPRQFTDPDLITFIRNTISNTAIDPGQLELEITEGMVMHDGERAMQILLAIKEMGIRIAIDDFGTGYSSLSQLKLFPVDTLKVDRSFIREIQTNSDDRALTKAIISMGKTLGLTVVAEGVETAEQQAFLSHHACDEMQGFYFSKPIEPDEFEILLRNHQPVPRS